MNWQGKNVLITGASEGLGKSVALALARRGARLVLVARRREVLALAAAEAEALGARVTTVVADVADKQSTYAVAAQAELGGPVDVLVHNASTLGPVPLRSCLETACEDLERVLQVNLVGPFRLSKALVGSMALARRGVIVHVGSDAASTAYPQWGAYGVSKAGFDLLARVWDAELEGTGVRVLNFDPGEMNTAMHAAALPEAEQSSLASPDEAAERLVALIETHWREEVSA